jgi:hypothetical protein
VPSQPGLAPLPAQPGQPGPQPGFAPAQPNGVVPPAFPAAPGYAAATPGSPVVAPAAPGGGASLPWWISGIPQQAWLRAALLGGLALAAGLIAALVTSLLSLRVVSNAADGLVSVGGEEVGAQWFPGAIQLWGMGYLGGLGGGLKAEVASVQMQGGVSAFFVPLVVPLASWAVLRWLAPRLGTPLTAPHWAPRAVLSAGAGLGAAVIVTVLTALIPITASASSSASISLRSTSFVGFVGVWAIVGALVYFSLRPRGSGPWGQIVRDASATALWHLWTLGSVLAIAALVYVCVKSESGEPLLSITLLVPFLATALFQLAYLIPFTASGAALLGTSSATAASMSLFSEGVPGWVWPIALVLALAWLVLASLRWRARRGLPGTNPLEWLALPSVYLLLGLALLIVDRIAVGLTFGTSGGAAVSVAPAAWGFLVLALVGLAIEALSRYVAIPLLRAIPAGLRGFLILGLPGTPSVPLPQAAPKAASSPTWAALGAAPGFAAPSGSSTPGAAGTAPAPAPAPGYPLGAAAPTPAQPWVPIPAPAAEAAQAVPSAPAAQAVAAAPAAAPAHSAEPLAPWGSQPPAAPVVPAPAAPVFAPLPAPAQDAPWAASPPPAPPATTPIPSPDPAVAGQAAVFAPANAEPAQPTHPVWGSVPEAPAEPTAVDQEDPAAVALAEPTAVEQDDSAAPGSAPLGGWTRPAREPGSGPRH